jgi:hypothetical protein
MEKRDTIIVLIPTSIEALLPERYSSPMDMSIQSEMMINLKPLCPERR